MSEFTVSDLKKQEEIQAIQALLSTTAAIGTDRRYHTLDAGLREYSLDLFGNQTRLLELVKSKISFKKDLPLRILVLGAGSGKMARDLCLGLGNESNRVNILEISLGDPRNQEEKDFDKNNNIKFVQGDIGEIKLKNSSLDLVISRMFMLHMIDPMRVTKKIYRALTFGGEFYSDFQFGRDFATKFRSDNERSQEEKAQLTILEATKNGSFISIDYNGMYLRKNRKRLSFNNLSYKKDKKGRIHYDLLTKS